MVDTTEKPSTKYPSILDILTHLDETEDEVVQENNTTTCPTPTSKKKSEHWLYADHWYEELVKTMPSDNFFLEETKTQENKTSDNVLFTGIKRLKYAEQVEETTPELSKSKSVNRHALHWAAMRGDVELVGIFLGPLDVPLEYADYVGNTTLLLACYTGQNKIVDLLVEKYGANLLNSTKCLSGFGPVHAAAAGNQTSTLKLLKDQYQQDLAVVNQKNGVTALHLAAWFGHPEVVRYLIDDEKCTSLVNQETKEGLPPVGLSITRFRIDMTDLLITKYQTKMPVAVKTRMTCFLAFRGHLGLLRTCIEIYNFPANTADEHGNTPLMLACLRKPIAREVVGWLLTQKSVVEELDSSTNDAGDTALTIVTRDKQACDVLELILEKAVNPIVSWIELMNAVEAHNTRALLILVAARKKLQPNEVLMFSKDQIINAYEVAVSQPDPELLLAVCFVYGAFPVDTFPTPAMLAADKGYVAILRALHTELKMDMDAVSSVDNTSAFHFALVKNHTPAALVLLRDMKVRVDREPYIWNLDLLNITANRTSLMKKTIHNNNPKSYLDKSGKEMKFTTLQLAAACSSAIVIEFLIKHNAEVNIKHNLSTPPVHMILHRYIGVNIEEEEGKEEKGTASPSQPFTLKEVNKLIKLLLDNGANVDAPDPDGWTLLHLVAHQGHFDTAKMLVEEYNANVNTRSYAQDTPIHIAAARGHVAMLKLFQEHKGWMDVVSHGPSGADLPLTPLRCALSQGNSMSVQFLLDSANAKLEHLQNIPVLGHLIVQQDVQTLKVLQDRVGKSVSRKWLLNQCFLLLQTFNGKSKTSEYYLPIHLAGKLGYGNLALWLINVGHSPCGLLNMPTGRNVLHYAVENNKPDVIEKLETCIRSGFLPINQPLTDGTNRTPLHLAAEHGADNVANMLIRWSADLLVKTTPDGFTPLRMAVECGHITTVHVIIEAATLLSGQQAKEEEKKDDELIYKLIHIRDIDGNSVMDVAAERGFVEIARILVVEAGATLMTVHPVTGNTPIHKATSAQQVNFLKAMWQLRPVQMEEIMLMKNYNQQMPIQIAWSHNSELSNLLLFRSPQHHLNLCASLDNYEVLHEFVVRYPGAVDPAAALLYTRTSRSALWLCRLIFSENQQYRLFEDVLLEQPPIVRCFPLGFTASGHVSTLNTFETIDVRDWHVILKSLPCYQWAILNDNKLDWITRLVDLYNIAGKEMVADKQGYYPLHIAALHNKPENLPLLFTKAKIQECVETDQCGWTAMMYALVKNHPDVVNSLLLYNPNMNLNLTKCKLGLTALHVACLWRRTNLVTSLFPFLAHLFTPLCQGLTALHLAALVGDRTLIQQILQLSPHGKRTLSQTENGTTPAHCAAFNGHVDALMLLWSTADEPDWLPKTTGKVITETLIEKQQQSKYSVLDYAVMASRMDCIVFLLGLDETETRRQQVTLQTLRLAAAANDVPILCLILNHFDDECCTSSSVSLSLSSASPTKEKKAVKATTNTKKGTTYTIYDPNKTFPVGDEEYNMEEECAIMKVLSSMAAAGTELSLLSSLEDLVDKITQFSLQKHAKRAQVEYWVKTVIDSSEDTSFVQDHTMSWKAICARAAAYSGATSTLEVLVERHHEVHETALCAAAICGQLPCLQVILKSATSFSLSQIAQLTAGQLATLHSEAECAAFIQQPVAPLFSSTMLATTSPRRQGLLKPTRIARKFPLLMTSAQTPTQTIEKIAKAAAEEEEEEEEGIEDVQLPLYHPLLPLSSSSSSSFPSASVLSMYSQFSVTQP